DNTNIGYSYDNLGRLPSKDPPGSDPTVTYVYDLLGRPTSVATSAQTLSFAYEGLGGNISQSGPHGTLSYGYDLAGQRTSMTYPDSGLVVGYSYDLAGEVTGIRENPSGSNTLLAAYAYTDLGLRAGIARGNGTSTRYSFDNVGRLNQLDQNLN